MTNVYYLVRPDGVRCPMDGKELKHDPDVVLRFAWAILNDAPPVPPGSPKGQVFYHHEDGWVDDNVEEWSKAMQKRPSIEVQAP